ncbi:hypothetical protein DFH08DRAFT_161387 [Mycena albidolilacea]|uniref:DUF6699 domain-containing protein n=1 Tax=Mycena albidolilacea TaxID=1033008 RepID=A0AAD7EQP3_9AGAR|nr:hypothetical protein DFH08DRAFT_161387 [Mycena albidolilacea]
MAAPFIFVPEANASTPYAPYQNLYYPSPQAAHTPVLPPASLLGTPNAFNPNGVLWPDEGEQYQSAYVPPRQRTLSWTGPKPSSGSPFLAPTAPAFLQSQPFKRGHKKAHSWSNTPAWVNNVNLNPYISTAAPPAVQLIHPFLNGEAPSPAFYFDLAPAAIHPMRVVSMRPFSGTPLTTAELYEPAFHPPLSKLRIAHPLLPLWPIDLALPAGAQAPPITLMDVLVTLHRALHTRISQADWSTLHGRGDAEARVTHAFATRCRAEALRSGAMAGQLRDREIVLRNQGVLRVDFLQGKTLFKGLLRHPEGWVELVTA